MEVGEKNSLIEHLQCYQCDKIYESSAINTVAKCGACESNPLINCYSLSACSPAELINSEEQSMWRYAQVLPVVSEKNIISLGEGWTPLLRLSKLQNRYELNHLLLKDESQNPTGSFKARGLSVAISKALELGITNCIVPTAGNAGGAMAAYCAKAGIQATVVMPSHTPEPFKRECELFGAKLILVDGLISDCAKAVAEINKEGSYFDLSTMKEPYRLEGKKTLGYELAEQLHFELPDVILYPTGGGTGLIGIWKALQEMKQLGWISGKLPRMIAVQSENCQPVVLAHASKSNGHPYSGSPTIANGLAVPSPFAKNLILKILLDSGGTAIAVSDSEIVKNLSEMARHEGLLLAPEGAALLAALKKLLHSKEIMPDEKIVLLNTGSGYKYLDSLSAFSDQTNSIAN